MKKNIEGQFEVIESFTIKVRNEFYLIGDIIEGTAKENWFVNVLNPSLLISLRISKVEDVLFTSEKKKYKLIVIAGDNETIDLLLGLNIGSETLDITIEGED